MTFPAIPKTSGGRAAEQSSALLFVWADDLDFDRRSPFSFLFDKSLGWMLPGRDAPLYHDKPYVSRGLLMGGRRKIAIAFFALIIGAVLWWQYTSPPTLDWSTSGESVTVDELQVRL